MGEVSKSEEPSQRDTAVPRPDKLGSRIGVEKYREFKEATKVKHKVFKVLRKLDMTDSYADFMIVLEKINNSIGISGEKWDD